MSKEIETNICSDCESHYKLIYIQSEASGRPKFCPFCGTECYDDDRGSPYEDDDSSD